MRELEHRRDSWVSIRDFTLEIIVIALIGWEIWIGYRAERLQKTNFEAEQKVFDNLEKSSEATAAALVAAQQILQKMNESLEKQLALSYDVMLVATYDNPSKKMIFSNGGRTNIALWGWKIEGTLPSVGGGPRTIIPGGSYGGAMPELTEILTKLTRKGVDRLVPFEIYVKNERGEEFTVYANFGITWQNEQMQVGTQTVTIVPDHWSRRLKNRQGASQPR
jgi:hypothetical protein